MTRQSIAFTFQLQRHKATKNLSQRKLCAFVPLCLALQLTGELVVDFNFHSKERRAVGLALRVCPERDCSSAIKTLVKQEVQRVKIRHLEAFDVPEADSSEMIIHA